MRKEWIVPSLVCRIMCVALMTQLITDAVYQVMALSDWRWNVLVVLVAITWHTANFTEAQLAKEPK